ncbi:hypothetical protein IFM89_016325 [Coptis chinensis]|uniref:F-box associated beta-propeller type 3 domain-containing protein n=1 Tax=Coptis chinensis TaxID=261450 RepID=A0A835HEX7_9MAGN|nr:hypothetical protein IFM89_016325 [Coptis chinensis]
MLSYVDIKNKTKLKKNCFQSFNSPRHIIKDYHSKPSHNADGCQKHGIISYSTHVFTELHLSGTSFPCRYSRSYLVDPEDFDNLETWVTAYELELKEFKNVYREVMLVLSVSMYVVGTVNRLIYFSLKIDDYKPVPYNVCNLITRGYIVVPELPKIGYQPMASGVGFDSLNNQYKMSQILSNALGYGNEVEVFIMGSDGWRVNSTNIPYVSEMNRFHVLLNECIHWVANSTVDDGQQCVTTRDYGERETWVMKEYGVLGSCG